MSSSFFGLYGQRRAAPGRTLRLESLEDRLLPDASLSEQGDEMENGDLSLKIDTTGDVTLLEITG
jgi:hypothetical protein